MQKITLLSLLIFLISSFTLSSNAQTIRPSSNVVPSGAGFLFVNSNPEDGPDLVYASAEGAGFVKRANLKSLISSAQSAGISLQGGHVLHALNAQGSNYIYYNQGDFWALSKNGGRTWQKLNQVGLTNITYEKYASPVGNLQGMYWAAKGTGVYYSPDGLNFSKKLNAPDPVEKIFAHKRKILVSTSNGSPGYDRRYILNGNSFSRLEDVRAPFVYVHPQNENKLFDAEGSAYLAKTWGNNPELQRSNLNALHKFRQYLKDDKGYSDLRDAKISDMIIHNNYLYVLATNKAVMNIRVAHVYRNQLAPASEDARVLQFDSQLERVEGISSMGRDFTNAQFSIVNGKLYLNYLGRIKSAGSPNANYLEHFVLNGNTFEKQTWGQGKTVKEAANFKPSTRRPLKTTKPVLKKDVKRPVKK